MSFSLFWRTLVYIQFSSVDECGHFLQLYSAAVDFGSQRSVSQPRIYVLSPAEGEIFARFVRITS